MIFVGMPGCDQGSTSLAWMMPPLPQLVSIAASAWRSTSTTSWPDLLRYQAVAVPTAPAPRTTVVIACPPASGKSDAPRPRPSCVLRFPIRLVLARRGFRRLALFIADPWPGHPHRLPLALDPARDVARDLTQDLLR